MIYFMRHGETDYNQEKRLQGHLDIPLNETGIAQANEALEYSKQLKLDEIYSSPLSRAKQTADIINSFHKVKITTDDRLKEICMGNLQGTLLSDLSEEDRDLSFSHLEHFGGESTAEFNFRVESFFKEIENSSKNILIVAHGGVFRAIYRYINNINNNEYIPLQNATIIKIKD